MIVATSQVANTVANLKSRYYKYLETLCNSNGIDIGNLKSSGSEYEELEMFFGGLPVLIGLKYFDHLRVLRLFGQDILNLKPLVEVSATLEELWICEGPLKVGFYLF
uniref:Glutaredoxin domain-containing protein n=1 Tax=Panagrellus redivivus TaxID=6233 RepID=A0A7E4VUW4_PANRE